MMGQALALPRSVSLLEQAAIFTERRHDVLAGNIANISTPGYRTRDLPVSAFQDAMQRAIASPPSTGSPSLGASLAGTAAAADSTTELFHDELFRAVERPSDEFTFQDGSNRSIEAEVLQLSRNSMLQNFAVELMTAQFNMLQAVISERA
jgi:flagellar basal-body rod protein FlgB